MDKPSILHLVTWLDVGGLEVLVRDISRLQKKKGYSISVGCMGGRKGVLAPEFEAEGIAVFASARWHNWFSLPRYTLSAAKIIKQSGANILHCHIDGILALIPIIVSRLLGVKKMVRTIHLAHPGNQWSFIKRIWRRIEITICVLLGVRFVAVSRDVRDNEQAIFKIPARWIGIILNGIVISHFDIQRASGLSLESLIGKDISRDRVFLLGCVARLRPQKNHCLLINTMAELLKRDCPREPHLLLAGVGPLEGQLRSLAKDLSVESNVHFLGLRRDVPQLLCEIDVFVLSSFFEGLPISIVEAMAAGKPVIATRVPGPTDIVVDGQTGIFVELDKPEEFADAIETLLNNAELREKMGLAGYERAKEMFSIDTCVRKYEKLYGLTV